MPGGRVKRTGTTGTQSKGLEGSHFLSPSQSTGMTHKVRLFRGRVVRILDLLDIIQAREILTERQNRKGQPERNRPT